MLAAGLQAWGRQSGDERTRNALGARGVLPGADYRVVGLELADGKRVARLPDGGLPGVRVALQPVFQHRFRGEPEGGGRRRSFFLPRRASGGRREVV